MRPDDALALVVFDTKADTVFPLTDVSKIDRDSFLTCLKNIKTRGGT